MNREETLSLYEQGVKAWNKWANEMLKEKKRLEEAGEWEAENSIFEGKISLNEKTADWIKKAEADFSSKNNPTVFQKKLDVENYIFPSNVIFENSLFLEETSFDNTEFKGNTSFVSTKFIKKVSFYNAIFYEKTSFVTSVTNDQIDFYKCIFKKEAHFEGSEISGSANFENTEFHGQVWFLGAIFKQSTQFSQSNFYGSAFFMGVLFKSETYFDNTVFDDSVMFESTSFNDFAFFEKTQFNKTVSFTNAKFIKTVSFNAANFTDITNFYGVTFSEEVIFNAICSNSSFTLEGANFKKIIPNFIQANFSEAPRLDNILIEKNTIPGSFINSITSFIHPEIKVRYQALKRLAIQAHDHENEQRFWAGELRSDRSLRTEDGSWNLRPLVSAFWWGNIAYGCISDYGRSIVRPIGALLILIGLMTGLHLTKSKTPLTYDQAFSAGYISTNKSFLYLGADPTKRSIIKEKYSALYGANENQTPKIPKTILTAEFFQTLFSAIFIFLALLGIRNNFKMK